MTIWTDVAEFGKAFGVAMLDTPGWPADEDVDLALRLIAEEVAELCSGLESRDMVATADGIVDVIYVTAGLGLRIGCIPIKLGRVSLLTDVPGTPTWDIYVDTPQVPRPDDFTRFYARLVEMVDDRYIELTEAYVATLIRGIFSF
ncbi:nucleoside triphosphate pyrophosphohydrolase family protein, partial [Bacillus subtilis]